MAAESGRATARIEDRFIATSEYVSQGYLNIIGRQDKPLDSIPDRRAVFPLKRPPTTRATVLCVPGSPGPEAQREIQVPVVVEHAAVSGTHPEPGSNALFRLLAFEQASSVVFLRLDLGAEPPGG